MLEPDFSDFTERAYRELLRTARGLYEFRSFRDAATMTSGVLWRHDIDVSVHRALALARLEHAENCRATYFVHLHSLFYNAFEDEVTACFRQIAELGHEFGVHFDPHYYGLAPTDRSTLTALLSREAAAIAALVGAPVDAVSFHNPDIGGWMDVDDDHLAGLVSAYGRQMRTGFGYCSDSNGYWRFEPIPRVIAGKVHPRLQVLTHPEWWVPQPLAPRQRIERAIRGRAERTAQRYDEGLQALGRGNLR